MHKHLTKSRFKTAQECPTKLHYAAQPKTYPNKKDQDEFLKALAEGGFQVGELAKLYHPTGIDIDTLDKEAALKQTNELLQKQEVTIFEAAITYDNLFIRVDILEKKGNEINLIEVKAKSFNSTEPFEIFNKPALKKGNHVLSATWEPYILDLAFQTYVIQKAFPKFSVIPHLMLADKSKRATVEGLHQLFLISKSSDGRTKAIVTEKTKKMDLGEKLLTAIPLVGEISLVINQVKMDGDLSFTATVDHYSQLLKTGVRAKTKVGTQCKTCEYRIDTSKHEGETKSGFQECWTEAKTLKKEDFTKELIFDVWDFRSAPKALEQGIVFASDLTEEDIGLKSRDDDKPGLSRTERQLLQVQLGDKSPAGYFFDAEGLKTELETFQYPMHFIDFETAMVAIPFHKGRMPYEQMAYQFSHHMLHADGRIEHSEYLDTHVGSFPNFDFIRALKKALEQDTGTIFRFASHENTVMNQIAVQLEHSSEPDRGDLIAWIETVASASKKSGSDRRPTRQFIDMRELTLRYYYLSETKGSNSIKKILPAVLNLAGSILKAKFPEWIQIDEKGKIGDPYKLLPPIFDDVDPREIEKVEMFLIEREDLNDGGAAMLAWARMQFTEMSETERGALSQALLRYCELDTLAMVMIWEWWQLEIKKTGKKSA
jgi:hypothetical protein